MTSQCSLTTKVFYWLLFKQQSPLLVTDPREAYQNIKPKPKKTSELIGVVGVCDFGGSAARTNQQSRQKLYKITERYMYMLLVDTSNICCNRQYTKRLLRVTFYA